MPDRKSNQSPSVIPTKKRTHSPQGLALSQQAFHNTKPFRMQRLPADGLACPVVPIGCVALIALLTVQVSVNPRAVLAFVLLCGFVCPLPIALAIPPQPSKGVRQSGWRLGRGER